MVIEIAEYQYLYKEMIMKKKIALLTIALIASNMDLTMAASADSMYNTLMQSFVLNAKSASEQAYEISKLQRALEDNKKTLQNMLLGEYYSSIRDNKTVTNSVFSFLPASLCLVHLGKTLYNVTEYIRAEDLYKNMPNVFNLNNLKEYKHRLFLAPAVLFFVCGLAEAFDYFTNESRVINVYKKQIQEIDAVLAKLEKAKKDLFRLV